MLRIENLSYGWAGREPLFAKLGFELKDGEIIAILGPNGIGKTTLLRSLMGFIPLQEGHIFLDNKDMKEIPEKEKWKQIAYVPQAKAPAFGLTSLEMVVLGRNAHINSVSSPKKKDYEMAEALLQKLGVGHLRDKAVNAISGGELQMVLIARALITEPRLLILDEPESNLDFRNQLKILMTIRELAEKRNIACIFNTHYPQHAFRIANKALLLGHNSFWKFGDSSEVLTAEQLRTTFGVDVAIHEVVDGDETWETVTALHLI